MRGMTQVKTVSELYPPQPGDEVQRLTAFLGSEVERGSVVLPRAATEDEVRLLADRRAVLARWVQRGSSQKLTLEIAAMLMGFGAASMSEDEARAIAAQYVAMVGDLPSFSVERACIKFGTGQVRPEEVGEKQLGTTFRPSTAQLYRVAAAIARPTVEEYAKVDGILSAKPPRLALPQTPEDRARVAEGLELLARDLAASWKMNEDDERRRANEEGSRRARERALESYDRLGLERPPANPGGLTPSPALLMSLGATIEEVEGRRVLVIPKRRPEFEPRETMPHEMGRGRE